MRQSTEGIAAYTPRVLREWLRYAPDERFREVDASLAFVDISGFTQLSENLARRGRVGAEELTDTINGCFTRLLAVAYDNGGSLLKFGGDALLLMFTGDDHPAAACRAANGMNASLAEIGELQTPDGPVTLRMSTGVHSGELHLFLVGDSHRELVIAGPEATTTVRTEAAAEAGEVLVSDRLAAMLPDGTVGASRGSCQLLVASPLGASEAAPSSVDDQPPPDAGIPVALRAQARTSDSRPEHRRVTVAFLRFQGFDDLIRDAGAAEAARELDRLVRDVQAAVDARGVAFLGTDIDADGGKIILTAGAPVSTGNDEERMLLALRDIVATERAIPIHIGVNTDHVFAGDIGPHYRRSYTVMGDGVNLAARLMAKAPAGDILATAAVLDRSRTTFEAVALEPFRVKGKAEPVQAHRVGDATGSRAQDLRDQLPIVGRADELQLLSDLLHGVGGDGGQYAEIVGEPGIGKTRLVDAFEGRAGGATFHRAACELYEASSPYAPVRRLLRPALGIPQDAERVVAEARLREIVGVNAPDLAPWLPLLGIPLDIELPPTDETATLDPQFRRARLNDTMVELLRAIWRDQVVLIVEDAQWMDEASSDLLHHLVAEIDQLPAMIVVTRRPVVEGFALDEGTPAVRVELTALEPAATVQLAQIATEDEPLAQHVLDVLVERSGGNPLFLQELIAATRQAGGLGGLPDSVEAVVTARIDQLPPTSRTLLRQLSVLGQTADVDLAACVLPDGTDADDTDIWGQLASFLSRDGETIRFRSTLIRDAAYQGLPFRDRRSLHAAVGDSLVRSSTRDPEAQADLLSYHYLLAERFDEAWRYSITAAQRAAELYANVAAARFYRRALESADELDDVPTADRSDIWEQLGTTLERLGEFSNAEDAYRAALELLDPDPVAESRLVLKQAQARVWLDDYEHALELIERGLELVDGVETPQARQQRSQLLAWYATFSQAQGRHETAVEWANRAIEEATAADERDALAHSYKTLDLVHMELRRPEDAVYSARALALYEELDDVPNQAVVLNNMGAIAYLESRWDEGRELYERAVELYERVGNVVGACFGRYNIAEILADQGYLEDAEILFLDVERIWRASAFLNGIAYARLGRGRIAAAVQHFDEALDLFGQARSGWADIGADARVTEADIRIAECYLLRHEPDVVIAITDEIIGGAREENGIPQAPLLHRLRGYAFLQRGEFAQARASLDLSLREAEEHDSHYEAALTKRAISDLLCRDGGDDTDLRQESRTVLTRLGVIATPTVPLPEAPAGVRSRV